MAKGYSIHIGLNLVNPAHYGGWDGRLRACEADANDMAAIARSLGYAHSTTLLTKDATSPRVISEVLRLSRTLRSGDILLRGAARRWCSDWRRREQLPIGSTSDVVDCTRPRTQGLSKIIAFETKTFSDRMCLNPASCAMWPKSSSR
jgi:hypothetical protein